MNINWLTVHPYEHYACDWYFYVDKNRTPVVLGNDMAGLQEYCLLDAYTTNKVPKGFTYDHGASVCFIGAGGNCGKTAVPICKLGGFGTIIATAAGANAEDIKSYGATQVINRHADDQEKQIRAIVGDDLIYAFDAVNLRPHARDQLPVEHAEGNAGVHPPGQVDAEEFEHKKAGSEEKFMQAQIRYQPTLTAVFATCLPTWLEQKKIKAVP
ncbi:hypothetical protein MMC18_002293 [Xylographa bjoerkii]|nr:hypothetical protein [Xylographa bjoerkii]